MEHMRRVFNHDVLEKMTSRHRGNAYLLLHQVQQSTFCDTAIGCEISIWCIGCALMCRTCACMNYSLLLAICEHHEGLLFSYFKSVVIVFALFL